MTTMEVVWLFVGFGLGALTVISAEQRSKRRRRRDRQP